MNRFKFQHKIFYLITRVYTCLILLILVYGNTALAFGPPGDAKGVKFIPNKGQWHDSVQYKARIPGGQLFIGNTTLTYQFWDQQQLSRYHHKKVEPDSLQAHVLKMDLAGANTPSSIEKISASKTTYNFFKGKDPQNWASALNAYQQVKLKSVYPGIDLVIKGQQAGIKYDFIVAPGANPNAIKLNWRGSDSLIIDDKQLTIGTMLQPLVEENPVAYQEGKKRRKTVPCHFHLNDNQVQFNFPEGYQDSQRLVIDPNVIFATFSGSSADNFGFTGTFDSSGHAYSAGTVYGSGFPTQPGAYQANFQGGKIVSPEIGDIERDAGILKYSEDGSQLLYATYLGGSHNEQPHSMIVNSRGELIIYGTTFSKDFPTRNSAFDQTHNGKGDMYLTKLSPNGSKIRASTFIGGNSDDGLNGAYTGGNDRYYNKSPLGYNYGDVFRGEVITDDQDNVYVASCTRSKDFPTTNSAINPNYQQGYQDGCVFKMGSDLSYMSWSTFIGGKNHDAAYSLKLDDDRHVYVVGGTKSQSFGGLSGFQSNLSGTSADGFILKIKDNGKKALAGTYWGSGKFDQNYFVDLDPDGDVYVTGQSEGKMPIKNVAVSSKKNSGQFISKFNQDLNQLRYSTVFGDSSAGPDIAPSAFLVDICENVYVSGWGGRTNLGSRSEGTSTNGLPITNNAYQQETDGSDFYLTVFKKGIDSLLYASFFGGSKSDEHVDGGTSRFNEQGMVYQSVCGGCHGNSDFPVTDDAYSKTNKTNRGCNNAFFKIKLDVANAPPEVEDTFIEANATDTLKHPLSIVDPNEGDSVFLNYEGSIMDTAEINGPSASITRDEGVKQFNGGFNWPTICEYANDTFTVELEIIDKGCPNPKSRKTKLKIVINEPPVFDPPDIFCSQVIDSNTLKLRWDEFEVNEYFSHFLLYRKNPDNNKLILDTISDPNKRSFTDNDAIDVQKKEYCYYLRAVNVCGKVGPKSYEICTGPKNQRAPVKRTVKAATVVNDKHIKVNWEKSTEPDFDKYQILRKLNKDNAKFKAYTSIDKQDSTNFIDKNTNVDKQSYCYKVQVKDVCGFFSKAGNKGCNVVLEGNSEPFEHRLNWNPYENWEFGVDHYTIYRWDPVADTNFRPIVEIDGQTVNYLDDSLNYDVGLYRYKVKAHKGLGKPSVDSNKWVSQSNTIELIQAPHIRVPNAFTINQDGLNESWGVTPVFVKDIHIQVFNRWGSLVFETKDKDESWQGPEMHSYEEKFDNVFIYKIIYTGWDESFHSTQGDLTILK